MSHSLKTLAASDITLGEHVCDEIVTKHSHDWIAIVIDQGGDDEAVIAYTHHTNAHLFTTKEPPMPTTSDLVVVLNDDSTFTSLEGCTTAQVALDENGDLPEDWANASLPLAPINDETTLLSYMRIFFPNLQLEEDSSGQLLIYTDIYPNGRPPD